MIMVGCSKNQSPNQIKLPTEVVRQNAAQDDNVQAPSAQDTAQQQNPTQEFDPVVYEEENDEIFELVNVLEELIQEQESQ